MRPIRYPYGWGTKGYSYDAVKIFQHNGKPVKVPYVEHVPPDTTACIFWLKNRKPEAWRDVKDHNVRATVNRLELTDEQLLAIAAGAVTDEAGEPEPTTH